MVNDYYVEDNSSTKMAQSERLFISCKTFDNDLTEEAFRRNVDLAWRITEDFKAKDSKKVNKVSQPQIVDHEPCLDCGCTMFFRSGTCFTCSNCSGTTGCS